MRKRRIAPRHFAQKTTAEGILSHELPAIHAQPDADLKNSRAAGAVFFQLREELTGGPNKIPGCNWTAVLQEAACEQPPRRLTMMANRRPNGGADM
jgi:hypothetical protein